MKRRGDPVKHRVRDQREAETRKSNFDVIVVVRTLMNLKPIPDRRTKRQKQEAMERLTRDE